jgi:hypothetical protein
MNGRVKKADAMEGTLKVLNTATCPSLSGMSMPTENSPKVATENSPPCAGSVDMSQIGIPRFAGSARASA